MFSSLRKNALLLGFSFFALGCHDGMTTPTSPVLVTVTWQSAVGASEKPSITAAGDSVVARAVVTYSCGDHTANGDLRGGQLTLRLVVTATQQLCMLSLSMREAVVVAHQVPRGMHTVAFVLRGVQMNGDAKDSKLAFALVDVH